MPARARGRERRLAAELRRARSSEATLREIVGDWLEIAEQLAAAGEPVARRLAELVERDDDGDLLADWEKALLAAPGLRERAAT